MLVMKHFSWHMRLKGSPYRKKQNFEIIKSFKIFASNLKMHIPIDFDIYNKA